jgi:hypothetical protein
MSWDSATSLGVLPLEGPVPYLHDDGRVPANRFNSELPSTVRTWWHLTHEPVPAIAARQGLIPSCWFGGDSCVVFGHDDFEPGEASEDISVIEVRSRALAGQLKALWVPWFCVVGVWRGRDFVPSRDLLAEQGQISDPVERCGCGVSNFCELSSFMTEQQDLWRSTWSTDGAIG